MKQLRIIACLLALFFLGGVCGAVLSAGWVREQARSAKWEDRWIETRMSEDAERLRLTPEQIEEVRPLYDRMLSDITRIRIESGRGLIEAGDRHYRDLGNVLTAEQQQQLRKIIEERSARWKESQP